MHRNKIVAIRKVFSNLEISACKGIQVTLNLLNKLQSINRTCLSDTEITLIPTHILVYILLADPILLFQKIYPSFSK